jgi:hypothetical protein
LLICFRDQVHQGLGTGHTIRHQAPGELKLSDLSHQAGIKNALTGRFPCLAERLSK